MAPGNDGRRIKAHYDGIKAFSETDFTEDLKQVTVPALVMHGDDDQIVPYADSGPLSAALLKNGSLKTYKGFPHGMPTTEAPTINADLFASSRSSFGPPRSARSRSGVIRVPPRASHSAVSPPTGISSSGDGRYGRGCAVRVATSARGLTPSSRCRLRVNVLAVVGIHLRGNGHER